jgi:hypothetical protein
MSPRSDAVAAGLLAISLAGCSGLGNMSSTDTDVGMLGVILFHAITGIGSSDNVARERVVGIPYASLGVRFGSSDESMFVLAGKTGDDLLWLGGPHLAVTTRRGRIVRTAGFAQNLSGFQSIEGTGTRSGQQYLYDFASLSSYGVVVSCSEQNVGEERIAILGVAHETIHIAQDCTAPQLDWSFRNEFWRDAAGFVWKSRQYAAPGLDPFTLEVLRPAE